MNSHLIAKKGKSGGKSRLKGRQTLESFCMTFQGFSFPLHGRKFVSDSEVLFCWLNHEILSVGDFYQLIIDKKSDLGEGEFWHSLVQFTTESVKRKSKWANQVHLNQLHRFNHRATQIVRQAMRRQVVVGQATRRQDRWTSTRQTFGSWATRMQTIESRASKKYERTRKKKLGKITVLSYRSIESSVFCLHK